MKTVNEVLTKIKGDQNIDATLTGKGSFSKAGFEDLVSAMVNDTSYKVKSLDKNGKEVETSISDLIRADLKKTLDMAKYPQKSESGVIDNCDIATNGLASAISPIVNEWMRCGKKFDLPSQKDMNASIYLAPVAAKVKTIDIRDINTKENLGTCTITTQDSVQVRAKSPVPKHLQTKVRKDVNGNKITK